MASLLLGYLWLVFITTSSANWCYPETWPDVDHGSICEECKVLVDNMGYYQTCDAYCQVLDCVCVGAWDDVDDTCLQEHYYNCDHDFGSYTSDAICHCNPNPATMVCIGDVTPGPDQCDESIWPDIKDGFVCSDCKVLVFNMNSVYSTCDNYCGNIGRTCTGAWEDVEDTCNVLKTENCQHDFGSYTSDAICECGGEGSTTQADQCDESSWPDVDQDCGDCKVLVKNMDSVYTSCEYYCDYIGRGCTGAWEDNHNDCSVLTTESCPHDFGSYTHDAICECGTAGGTTPPDQCDESSWPDVDHDCGDCKVLVRNMDTVYSTCGNYCDFIGHVCTGAWEDKHDDCAVFTTESCLHDFGSYTHDAICECGE